jgi:hypothetical protein
MGRWMIGAAVLLVLAGGCAVRKRNVALYNTGIVESKYDEFKKQNVVTYQAYVLHKDSGVGSGGTARTAAGLPLQYELRLLAVKEQPEVVGIQILSESKDWVYLKCHTLDLLVDGNPLSAGETDHDGDTGIRTSTGDPGVRETITAVLPPAAVVQMAGAKEIRGRLCGDEWSFKPEQIGGLAAFVEKAELKSAPTPPASSAPSSAPAGN